MCGMEGMLAKDFHKLMKSIASFSNSQAEVCHYEENLESFKVEIVPNNGVYFGGKFNFEVTLKDYPNSAPNVTCVTQIYHPNIDNDNGEICLNLFSEWVETNTLEDCVQGLLFLLYNPNLDDPLSPLFDPQFDNDYDDFAQKVQRSLEGGEVEGYTFERNLVDDDKCTPVTTDESTHCQTDEVEQAAQNVTAPGSDTAISESEVLNNTTEANGTTTTITDKELNTTIVTDGSKETDEDAATSNLNTETEEAVEFISGKVHPHRTEDIVGCPLF